MAITIGNSHPYTNSASNLRQTSVDKLKTTGSFSVPEATGKTANGGQGVANAASDERIDFTNITPDRALDVANQLFRAGEISLDDALKVASAGRTSVDPNDNAAIANKPSNILARLESSIEFLKGQPDQAANVKSTETLLAKLQSLNGSLTKLDQYA